MRGFVAKNYEVIVEDIASQEVAGRASIDWWKPDPWAPDADKMELAIVIGKSFWGCKYRYGRKVAEILIKEAFGHPDCNAVIGIVHPQNIHSQALLDHFHFANKGLLEWSSFAWQKGALVYELTRERYVHGEG